MFASIAAKINNFRLCLHGTGQEFHRSKICEVHTVYTEPSLFLHENIFCLHGTGYLRSYSEPAVFFSDLPREHAQINPLERDGSQKKKLQMSRKMIPPTLKNILHRLTKKYLCFCKLPLLIKTKKKQTKERTGNRSNHATKIFGNYFFERYPKSTTEPEHFLNVIDSAKVFN